MLFSPDSRTLATATDRTARLWDVGTGQSKATLTGHTDTIHTLAFSPDGRLFGTAGQDGTARLWDAQTGEAKSTLNGHTGSVDWIAFSPGGESVATASADGTAKLWGTRTGQLEFTFAGGTKAMRFLAFSPNEETLATVSDQHVVQLWDVSWLHDPYQAPCTQVGRAMTPAEWKAYVPDLPFMPICGSP